MRALGHAEIGTFVDTLTVEERSARMARIRGKDTKPEMVVRRTLHRLGYRYRLHRKDLPGRPDIVLPARKVVLFVHGCLEDTTTFENEDFSLSFEARPKWQAVHEFGAITELTKNILKELGNEARCVTRVEGRLSRRRPGRDHKAGRACRTAVNRGTRPNCAVHLHLIWENTQQSVSN